MTSLRKKNIHKIHEALGNLYHTTKDDEKIPIDYILRFSGYHYSHLPTEHLWELVNDHHYRQKQIQFLQVYQPSYRNLIYGLIHTEMHQKLKISARFVQLLHEYHLLFTQDMQELSKRIQWSVNNTYTLKTLYQRMEYLPKIERERSYLLLLSLELEKPSSDRAPITDLQHIVNHINWRFIKHLKASVVILFLLRCKKIYPQLDCSNIFHAIVDNYKKNDIWSDVQDHSNIILELENQKAVSLQNELFYFITNQVKTTHSENISNMLQDLSISFKRQERYEIAYKGLDIWCQYFGGETAEHFVCVLNQIQIIYKIKGQKKAQAQLREIYEYSDEYEHLSKGQYLYLLKAAHSIGDMVLAERIFASSQIEVRQSRMEGTSSHPLFTNKLLNHYLSRMPSIPLLGKTTEISYREYDDAEKGINQALILYTHGQYRESQDKFIRTYIEFHKKEKTLVHDKEQLYLVKNIYTIFFIHAVQLDCRNVQDSILKSIHIDKKLYTHFIRYSLTRISPSWLFTKTLQKINDISMGLEERDCLYADLIHIIINSKEEQWREILLDLLNISWLSFKDHKKTLLRLKAIAILLSTTIDQSISSNTYKQILARDRISLHASYGYLVVKKLIQRKNITVANYFLSRFRSFSWSGDRMYYFILSTLDFIRYRLQINRRMWYAKENDIEEQSFFELLIDETHIEFLLQNIVLDIQRFPNKADFYFFLNQVKEMLEQFDFIPSTFSVDTLDISQHETSSSTKKKISESPKLKFTAPRLHEFQTSDSTIDSESRLICIKQIVNATHEELQSCMIQISEDLIEQVKDTSIRLQLHLLLSEQYIHIDKNIRLQTLKKVAQDFQNENLFTLSEKENTQAEKLFFSIFHQLIDEGLYKIAISFADHATKFFGHDIVPLLGSTLVEAAAHETPTHTDLINYGISLIQQSNVLNRKSNYLFDVSESLLHDGKIECVISLYQYIPITKQADTLSLIITCSQEKKHIFWLLSKIQHLSPTQRDSCYTQLILKHIECFTYREVCFIFDHFEVHDFHAHFALYKQMIILLHKELVQPKSSGIFQMREKKPQREIYIELRRLLKTLIKDILNKQSSKKIRIHYQDQVYKLLLDLKEHLWAFRYLTSTNYDSATKKGSTFLERNGWYSIVERSEEELVPFLLELIPSLIAELEEYELPVALSLAQIRKQDSISIALATVDGIYTHMSDYDDWHQKLEIITCIAMEIARKTSTLSSEEIFSKSFQLCSELSQNTRDEKKGLLRLIFYCAQVDLEYAFEIQKSKRLGLKAYFTIINALFESDYEQLAIFYQKVSSLLPMRRLSFNRMERMLDSIWMEMLENVDDVYSIDIIINDSYTWFKSWVLVHSEENTPQGQLLWIARELDRIPIMMLYPVYKDVKEILGVDVQLDYPHILEDMLSSYPDKVSYLINDRLGIRRPLPPKKSFYRSMLPSLIQNKSAYTIIKNIIVHHHKNKEDKAVYEIVKSLQNKHLTYLYLLNKEDSSEILPVQSSSPQVQEHYYDEQVSQHYFGTFRTQYHKNPENIFQTIPSIVWNPDKFFIESPSIFCTNDSFYIQNIVGNKHNYIYSYCIPIKDTTKSTKFGVPLILDLLYFKGLVVGNQIRLLCFVRKKTAMYLLVLNQSSNTETKQICEIPLYCFGISDFHIDEEDKPFSFLPQEENSVYVDTIDDELLVYIMSVSESIVYLYRISLDGSYVVQTIEIEDAMYFCSLNSLAVVTQNMDVVLLSHTEVKEKISLPKTNKGPKALFQYEEQTFFLSGNTLYCLSNNTSYTFGNWMSPNVCIIKEKEDVLIFYLQMNDTFEQTVQIYSLAQKKTILFDEKTLYDHIDDEFDSIQSLEYAGQNYLICILINGTVHIFLYEHQTFSKICETK